MASHLQLYLYHNFAVQSKSFFGDTVYVYFMSLFCFRVVQKNLVFVVGLSTRLADTEVLKRQDYFGKYGKILKVVINSSTSYAGAQVCNCILSWCNGFCSLFVFQFMPGYCAEVYAKFSIITLKLVGDNRVSIDWYLFS